MLTDAYPTPKPEGGSIKRRRLCNIARDGQRHGGKLGDEVLTIYSSPSDRSAHSADDSDGHPSDRHPSDSSHGQFPCDAKTSSREANTAPLQTPAHDFVCFGALVDIRAQLLVDPDTVITMHTDNGMVFDVVRNGHCFGLKAQDRIVAGINVGTCKGLESLASYDLLCKGFVTMQEWVNKLGRSLKKHKCSTVISVSLLIHGPSSAAEAVGSLLSDAKLYLQQPLESPAILSERTLNPHILTIADPEGTAQLNTELRDADRLVQPLFESSSQAKFLNEAELDGRMITNLRSHQLIAVDFILRKETNSLPDPLNLWQARQSLAGIQYYEHAITHETRAGDKPSEHEGGILADVMGSGKTAVMLAVIVATVVEARSSGTSPQSLNNRPCDRILECGATLIVVPSALILDNWVAELGRRVKHGVLRLYKYHGRGKEISNDRLAENDIVITTYATVQVDAADNGWKFFRSIKWYRIVLDEAHVIRTPTSKQYQAIQSIPARYRWCLTGTPMQNKLKDFGSLLHFLSIPFLQTNSEFRKHLIAPMFPNDSKRPDTSNLQKLLASIYLRRTRAAIGLQKPNTEWKHLKLSLEEMKRYEEIGTSCDRACIPASDADNCDAGTEGPFKPGKAQLRKWLRLRIACNHGTFEPPPPSLSNDPLVPTQATIAIARDECLVCSNDSSVSLRSVAATSNFCSYCAARLCCECLPEYMINQATDCSSPSQDCHYCERSFKLFTPGNSNPKTRFDQMPEANLKLCFSTKLEAIAKDVYDHLESGNCLVFSFWTESLKLLRRLLLRKSIKAELIHGEIPVMDRRRLISSFENQETGGVLLMTLNTGAVGLNLFSAHRIHIVEPQWNPAVEDQAISRSVRLGQTRPITVIRYLMEDTVETSLVRSTQAWKRRLAESFQRDSKAAIDQRAA